MVAWEILTRCSSISGAPSLSHAPWFGSGRLWAGRHTAFARRLCFKQMLGTWILTWRIQMSFLVISRRWEIGVCRLRQMRPCQWQQSLSLSLILWLSLSMYVSLYLCISVYMHRERERERKKNTLWSSGERSYQPVSRLAHGLTKTEALLGAQLRHSAFGRATWRLHTFGDGVAWENDQIFTNLIELSEWLVHMTFSMQTAHIPKANRDSRGRRSRPPKLGRCIPARCHPWSILKPGHFGHMGMVIIFTMLCRLCRGWDCSVWN